MKNIITVVIPVYKNSHLLIDALQSLKLQTYKKFEVIVVNDGSQETRQIKKIVASFKSNLKLTLYNLKKNRGVSYALNKGIKNAKGKYISWLSHDDYFHPDKFKKQIKIINKNKLVFTGFYLVDIKKNIIKKKLYGKFFFKHYFNILLRDNLNLCTALVHKDIYKQSGLFDLKKKHTQDYEMMYKLFKRYKVLILNQPLFFSRTHNNQTSKLFNKEANIEKINFLNSKFHSIKNVFNKSNIFKKIYIIFFLRLKNIDKVSTKVKKLTENQNIFFTLILKIIFVLSGFCSVIKKK